MYEYLVEHCRKNVLSDTLIALSTKGWKLHSIFQEASGYMLVLERQTFPLLTSIDDVPSLSRPEDEPSKPKTKKVAFVKTKTEE